VLGLISVLCGITVPYLLQSIERARAMAAARYVAQQCGLARFQAVARSAIVAVRFLERDGEYEIEMFLDGNRNGVRTVDIASGVDVALTRPARLTALFAGARIGIAPELQLGNDPVALGPGGLLSFTPVGTATAGSIYVIGRDRSQYVVRVLGATARTRLQRFDPVARDWVAP